MFLQEKKYVYKDVFQYSFECVDCTELFLLNQNYPTQIKTLENWSHLISIIFL